MEFLWHFPFRFFARLLPLVVENLSNALAFGGVLVFAEWTYTYVPTIVQHLNDADHGGLRDEQHLDDNEDDSAPPGPCVYNIGQAENVFIYSCDITSSPHVHDDGEVIAKLAWESERDKRRAEALKKEKEEIELKCNDLRRRLREERKKAAERMRQIADELVRPDLREDEQERRYQALMAEKETFEKECATRMASIEKELAEEKLLGERRLASLHEEFEKERKDEREQIMTFVLALESRMTRIINYLEEQQLAELAERLHSEFNIRLLGVDCGLRFLMEAPVDQWARLVEKHVEIERELGRLLPQEPEDHRQWHEMVSFPGDVDLQLQRPLPSNVIHLLKSVHRTRDDAPSEDAGTSDPETHQPAFSHYLHLRAERGTAARRINSVLIDGNRVIVADCDNRSIEVINVYNSNVVGDLKLGTEPWALAQLSDRQLLAVTTTENIILCIRLVENKPDVEKQISTSKQYRGVAECPEGLVVSWPEDEKTGPAGVEIITLEGQCVRTVCTSDNLTGLKSPYFLCVFGESVYISDIGSDSVYVLSLGPGDSLGLPVQHDRLVHERLQSPTQVCADHEGNLYMASWGGQCVLVWTAADREWRERLEGSKDGEGDNVHPRCVSVAGSKLLVGWDSLKGNVLQDSVLKVYNVTQDG